MIDVIQEAQADNRNTISLGSLMGCGDARFQDTLLWALVSEGFELDEPLPSLQHPLQLLNALQWVGTVVPGAAWETFQKALQRAEKAGILVDMGIWRAPVLQSA